MILSIILPGLLAAFAFIKNKLTIPAIVFAWLLGFIICYFGGYFAFSALVLTFVLTILSDKIKKGKGEKRNIYQIICNVLIPAISILLFKLTSNYNYYIIYYAVIGSSLADTLASSIGLLSKGYIFNPLNFKKMEKGLSGAVSLLGFGASLLGGLILGIVYFIYDNNIKFLIFISFMSLLGSYIDSVFGILLQGKYVCSVCNKTIDENKHCDKAAVLTKGYSFFDNNVVNFLNNFLIFIISYIILMF